MGEKNVPERRFSRAFPSVDELKELIRQMDGLGISIPTKLLMVELSMLEPERRLAVNLKVVLGLSTLGEVSNVLQDGLTRTERNALLELDSSPLPVVLREVAHGLLNVHERWVLLRSMSKAFRMAKANRNRFLESVDDEGPMWAPPGKE